MAEEDNGDQPASNEETAVPRLDNSSSDEPIDNTLDLPGDPSSAHHPHFKSAKNRRRISMKSVFLSLLLLILVVGIGYGVYSLVIKRGQPEVPVSQPDTSSAKPSDTDSSDQAVQALSETYTSSRLRLDFKYPADWKVNEVDGGIRIESPSFTYVAKDQSEVNGNFRIYLRKGARAIDGQFLGNAFALSPSQNLEYTSPVSGQRDSTWLTSFWRGSPDGFFFFVVQGNYQLKKGDTLGPDFAKEPGAYLIVGGYSKPENKEDLNMVAMPESDYDQTQQYQTAQAIIQSLQLK